MKSKFKNEPFVECQTGERLGAERKPVIGSLVSTDAHAFGLLAVFA
jgi:hypothetical protein